MQHKHFLQKSKSQTQMIQTPNSVGSGLAPTEEPACWWPQFQDHTVLLGVSVGTVTQKIIYSFIFLRADLLQRLVPENCCIRKRVASTSRDMTPLDSAPVRCILSVGLSAGLPVQDRHSLIVLSPAKAQKGDEGTAHAKKIWELGLFSQGEEKGIKSRGSQAALSSARRHDEIQLVLTK